jgi:hypothetical protein
MIHAVFSTYTWTYDPDQSDPVIFKLIFRELFFYTRRLLNDKYIGIWAQ